MGTNFNLLDEPWVPCVMADGSAQELSLTDALLRAHEARELFDESPLVTVALHRLLLAILHRNFGPASIGEWFQLWRRGRWNEETLKAYFTRWHERFELFHPERPFYQMPEAPSLPYEPITVLFQELSSGNNPTLFDHSLDRGGVSVSPALAARGLVAQQTCGIASGRGYSPAPLGGRGFSLLAEGDSLFETLALNLLPYDAEHPRQFPRSERCDVPAWEADEMRRPSGDGDHPSGYVDYLTWQSRYLHLFPEADGSVRFCQRKPNLRFGRNARPLDPFIHYRKHQKGGWLPLELREDHALWRDSHVLLEESSVSERENEREELIHWLARIAEDSRANKSGMKKRYSLSVFGIAAEKNARVMFWRHERLPLPLAYLEDHELLGDLGKALAYAEKIGQELRAASWTFAKVLLTPPKETGLAPRREDIERIARSLAPKRRFWPVLESRFLRLMTELPKLDAAAREDELLRWRAEVRGVARKALEETVRDLNASTRELKAVAVTERAFNRKLRHTLEPEETL